MNLNDDELYHLLNFMAYDSLFTNKDVPRTWFKLANKELNGILETVRN